MGRRRGSALVLGSILLTAFIERLLWALWTAPVPAFLSDAQYYNATALSIARGLGYSLVFDSGRGFLPGGVPTAFWPPGYSAFLAIWYWLFGEKLMAARLANVAAGTLTVVPTYFIGRRLFGKAAGLAGAAIVSVLPSMVFWTPVLMSDTFFTLIFASALAFLLYSIVTTGRSVRELCSCLGWPWQSQHTSAGKRSCCCRWASRGGR